MDDLINKVGFYFWVAVVGLVGGILSLTNNDALKSGKAVINLIVGTVSSMFVCWLAYEITFYFTEKDRFSLAVGGFFAWRGAVWMNIFCQEPRMEPLQRISLVLECLMILA